MEPGKQQQLLLFLELLNRRYNRTKQWRAAFERKFSDLLFSQEDYLLQARLVSALLSLELTTTDEVVEDFETKKPPDSDNKRKAYFLEVPSGTTTFKCR
ncbi:hypothetical protein K7432_013153 [Basidiobolus ranarum]|uniref:Uncharacterized protein n=1 Tax=Basidiobolus ranarum TaxID=34480 RepID=A0ABR2VRA9_9FUNG